MYAYFMCREALWFTNIPLNECFLKASNIKTN